MVLLWSQNGFVIATDALLALAILFALVGLAFETINTPGTGLENQTVLRELVTRAAFALEQGQLLQEGVILDNTTPIRSVIDAWPATLCGSVQVFSSPDSNIAAFIVTKTGCVLQTAGVERVRHGFIVPTPPDANFWVVEVTAWPSG
ncbi:MAG: hypothetical protein Q8P05_00505 [Candidatus Diapherotrites archaeon]|nr:hypothetical protein [Candidatus Diapherotrites archaeon]MDZ4256479.1 hypothetical protein [archaeon]